MKTKTGLRLIEILLVKDSPTDALLAREALEYSQAPRPDLVLLDLNLPRKNGCEVLTEIKMDVTPPGGAK